MKYFRYKKYFRGEKLEILWDTRWKEFSSGRVCVKKTHPDYFKPGQTHQMDNVKRYRQMF